MKKIIPLLLIIMMSCNKSEPKLLTEQEYLAFGQRIANTLKSGNVKKLSNLLNLSGTYKKLSYQIDSLQLESSVSDAKRKSYVVEMNQGFTQYLETLSKLLQNDGTIEVSKYYEKEGKPHLIFAVHLGNNSREFTDLELLTIGDQTVITDYESYNTGIQFSESFIWNAINTLEFGWMGGEYMDALSELKNAHVYLQRQQPDRAWIAINRVPEDFLYQSNFQTVKVQIASQLSDSLYINSLFEWVGYNYDQEGFRYLKGYEYFSYFGDTIQAESYVDSLEVLAGKSFLTEKLKQQMHEVSNVD